MIKTAPFYAELTKGATEGGAVWLQTRDGVRIRAGHWPALSASTKGTVVILPGRTEYIEKYGELAGDLARGGWASLALDWRGQGLSDRLTQDRALGHVERFRDYQLDLDRVMEWLADQGGRYGLCPPYMLFAHSMGGLIGLRALYRNLQFRAVAFSAPMWGIKVPLLHRPMAAVLSRAGFGLPQDLRYAPRSAPLSYIASAPFEGNLLTGDLERWERLKSQIAVTPDFALGGPSLRWVREGVREARRLLERPAPALPMLTALGGAEAIVEPAAIRKRVASWPLGRLDFYPEARHEIAHERDEVRAPFVASLLALYEAQL